MAYPASPRRPERLWPAALAVLGPPLLAVALALLAHALGLRGGDEAAQTYRVSEVRVYGLVLWDSGWYGGNLPMGYSVAFPLLGAAVGLVAVGVVAAAVSTYAFDRLVVAAWGRRGPASWYFAASTMLQVAIGQLPFLTGEAIGLVALLALGRGRTRLAVGLMAASALFSPLAALFAALACVAWALDRRSRLLPSIRQLRARRFPARRLWARRPSNLPSGRSTTAGPGAALVMAGAALTVIALLGVIFPNTGPFPYRWGALVLTLVLCATVATPLVPANPVLRWGAGLYALAAVGAFVVPNAVGGNAARLGQAIGVPLLAGLICLPDPAAAGATVAFPRRRSSRARSEAPARFRYGWGRRGLRTVAMVAVLGGFATWQWGPGLNALNSPRTDAAADATFYQPLLHQILNRSNGPVRVEAVPTKDHWEAAYLAPRVSLARGWERQLDLADNPLFYRPGALSPRTYLSWLRHNGVTWVALPDTTLDYAATAEAALLARPLPGLTLVWSSPRWRLWKVNGGPGILSGPGHLIALGPDRLRLSVARPSVLTIRIRYTTLWNLPLRGSATASACLLPGPDGWTDVVASRAGNLDLAISVFQGHSATCPSR